MDLLARYLQAVRFFLPASQQDDIVRELEENLRSQIEEREETLGRPLTEEELSGILRQHGHPMIVAGRYRVHRQLIGPALFPIYVFALKLGLAVALIVTTVLAFVNAALSTDPARQIVNGLFAYPGRALMVFALTTLGFAVLDLAQSHLKLGVRWDPRRLPKLNRREHRIPLVNSVIEALATTAALIWLLLIPDAPYLLMGPAATFLALAPIWRVVYIPILILTVATISAAVADVVRPYWTRGRSVWRIAIQVGGLVVIAMLLNADTWIVARSGAVGPPDVPLDRVVRFINRQFPLFLCGAAIVNLIEIGREVHRLVSRRKPLVAESSPARAER
jgi:hypothetical protein